MEVRVICINDQKRPEIIPAERFVKKGEEYRVIHVATSINENSKNVLMFTLAELDISEYEPYGAFRADRFAIDESNLDKLEELAKLCTELNGIDIEELTRQLETIDEKI